MRGEFKLYWVLGALLLSFVLFVTAGDVIISLSIGTPQNGSYAQGDSIFVNASANTTSGNVSIFLDFNNSLVSWWRMDDANSTHVFDYMGRNNGTLVGGAIQSDMGYMGKGVLFDGGGGYISLGNRADFKVEKKTVSMWIKRGTYIDTTSYLFSSGTSNYFITILNTGALRISWTNSSGVQKLFATNTSFNSPEGVWTNIALTYNVFGDNVDISIYKDGTVYTSSQSTQGYSSTYGSNFDIGRYAGTGTGFFNGTIDDVMIFNRSLSASEIQALYANQSTKYLEKNITSLSEETHSYTLYAQDTSGNVTSSTQIVTLDNTAPVIEINSPLNQAYTSSPISFNVSVTDTNSLSDCWYLVDSDGVNVSMTNVSAIYTASYSPSGNGDYSVVFYCNDSAGNLNVTEAVNFSLAIPVVETEAIEESVSSGYFGAPTYSPSEEKLLQGYEVSLGSNFKVDLSLGSGKHQLFVNSIQNGIVNITISSDPVTFTLQVSQTKKIDLNSDGSYDLSIYLKKISSNRADLVVTSILELYNLPEEIAEDTATPADKLKTNSKNSSIYGYLKPLFYLLFGTLALSAAALLGSYFLRRKKKG